MLKRLKHEMRRANLINISLLPSRLIKMQNSNLFSQNADNDSKKNFHNQVKKFKIISHQKKSGP